MNKSIINRLLMLIAFVLTFSGKAGATVPVPWEVNPNAWQYDMSLYLSCRLDLDPMNLDRYVVGAFVGDECRGIGKVLNNEGLSASVVSLRARSNEVTGEMLSFRCFDTESGNTYNAAEEIPFEANGRVGYPSDPFEVIFYDKYAPLEAITLSSTSLTIEREESKNLIASLVPENALPVELIWTSSAPEYATVADGVVMGIANGESVITVKGGEKEAICNVTVVTPKVKELTIAPTELSLFVGASANLAYTLKPEDAVTTITWKSSDEKIATVVDGNVAAVAPGKAVITATTDNGLTAEASVVVNPVPAESIKLDKTELTGYPGDTFTLNATLTPDNVTYLDIVWQSDNESVAKVSDKGIVTLITPGNAVITATTNNGLEAEAKVTVNPVLAESVELNLKELNGKPGDTFNLKATLTPDNVTYPEITWKSEDDSIAKVSNEGVVTLVAPGETIITASCGDVAANCSVKVNDPDPVVPDDPDPVVPDDPDPVVPDDPDPVVPDDPDPVVPDDPDPVVPDDPDPVVPDDPDPVVPDDPDPVVPDDPDPVVPDDPDPVVPDDPDPVVPDNPDPVVPDDPDPVVPDDPDPVVPDDPDPVVPDDPDPVVPDDPDPVVPDDPDPVVPDDPDPVVPDDPDPVVPDDPDPVVPDDPDPVVPDDPDPVVPDDPDPVVPDDPDPVVPDVPEVIPVSSITLSETAKSLKPGELFTLTTTVLPENASDKAVAWTSSDPVVATVSVDGLVTALKPGKAVISAIAADGSGVRAECTITVNKPDPVAPDFVYVTKIELSASSWSGLEGKSFTLSAQVLPENANDKTINWTSSNTSVATVSADGVVRTIKEGKAVITAIATDGSGTYASCDVTVAKKIIYVESLVIDPEVWEGEVGSEFIITATILPENATDQAVKWESSDNKVATVDSKGNVKVIGPGECMIIATAHDPSYLNARCMIYAGNAAVEAVYGDSEEKTDVYTTNGMLLKKDCSRDDLKQLAPGMYILRCGNKSKIVHLSN